MDSERNHSIARRFVAARRGLLSPSFTVVHGVRTRDALQQEVVGFARGLGFDTVSVTAVVDKPLGATEFTSVDNTPRGYRAFFEDPANFGADPVMQHCKVRSTPIVWDETTYISNGADARWEQQAPYGYRFGVAMALHLPQGRHFFIGAERDRALPSCEAELTRIVGALSLFALHAHEASIGILTPTPAIATHPALTPRELEVLRWTIDGKTAWEVGVILGISDRTVAIHANNATRKLDCVNKNQAALKALRTGLINST